MCIFNKEQLTTRAIIKNMQQLQWIVDGRTHRAVIASNGGYANLTASKRSFTVEFVSEYFEDTVVYSSVAKNLNDAKRLCEAFGHSLLKDSGCYRPSKVRSPGRKSPSSKSFTRR